MLEYLNSNPIYLILLLLSLVVAIDIHEFSHAWMAETLGDPTPRLAGRLSLNPLAHLDPMGSLALLLFGFGWGKPVPIDPYNLRNPRKDSALISLAGPASNLILALILALLLKFVPIISLLSLPLAILISLNVTLGVFNLLPLGPLDGAKILVGFLPLDLANQTEDFFNKYGLILMIFVLFPFFGNTSLATGIISPIINLILHLLLP